MDSATREILRSNRWSFAAGVAAALLALGGMLGVGRVGQGEAIALLHSILPTVRFLCSGVMTATATILALMLTMLGIAYQSNEKLTRLHYRRIRIIAVLDTAAFIGSTLLLLWLAIPLEQSEPVHRAMEAIYYAVTGLAAALGGLLVVVVLLLYEALHHMIRHAETGDHLTADEDEEAKDAAEARG